jgi:cupin 2 domain-containing protein
MNNSNLFADIPAPLPGELVHRLLTSPCVRIERIVSREHASPPGFWYDQQENEWVLLIQGAARVRYEAEVVEMRAGDFINIPAHQKHRVDWTTPDGPTIWLAVYYPDES